MTGEYPFPLDHAGCVVEDSVSGHTSGMVEAPEVSWKNLDVGPPLAVVSTLHDMHESLGGAVGSLWWLVLNSWESSPGSSEAEPPRVAWLMIWLAHDEHRS